MPSSAVRRPRGTSLHGDRWQTSQEGERAKKTLGPWPLEGGAQRRPARTADQAARNREESRAHRARHGEVIGGRELAQRGGPADEVVGEHGAEQPGRVGEELSGGHVLESGSFFEVPDGEFDTGMFAMERIDVDGMARRDR